MSLLMPHIPTLHKVLLIEDNAADARLVSYYLDQTTLIKTKLTHVSNLKEGAALIEQESFSVILLDLSLHDSQGLATLQKLRNLFPKQILNIIVLTGNIDKSLGIDAIRLGAQDYLIKSNLDPDILGKAIRFAIERHQTYRYLNETQRQAKIGSWRYRPSSDEFFASDLVYEILGCENTNSEYLSDAIEKSGSSFLIFVHYLEEEKEYPNLHKDHIARKPNGNVIHIIIKSERTVSLDNQIQINGTIQDITHRVRMEELSKEAEFNKKSLEVKEQFIANVSHEMRTPMNAILGLSRLLLNADLNQEQLQYIKSIYESSEMLLGIVNDILEMTSHQKGTLQLYLEPVNIRQLINYIEALLMHKINEKGLLGSFQVDNQVPTYLLLDKLRIQQILLNLIGNSVKFTETGSISVFISISEIRAEDLLLSFKITDTGIGIPSEQLDAIFIPYTTVRHENKAYESTGLGLTIVKTWIDQMNGSVEVESALGTGTSFEVKIPARPTELKVPTGDSNISPLFSGNYDWTILLVDDHHLNLLVAMKTLEKKCPGAKVITAINGEKALEELESHHIDIVLMDLQMPIMDGYETTKIIRQSKNPIIANVPILAMTANAYITKDNSFTEKGFTDYVLKPFDPDLLLLKMNKYLRS